MSFRHPSLDITGSTSKELAGHCIALGVTASASIYRSLDTARALMRRGAEVHVIMTRAAADLVSPKLFHWATGNRPVVAISGDIEHVEMAHSCSAMLLAPATYSSITKLALGIADNPVVLTAITMMGYGRPVAVVPAMHEGMERSPQYQDAVSRLKGMGVLVIPPLEAESVAKYPDPYLVARAFTSFALRGFDMKGLRVLVTAGATRSWIDSVRFVSNPSSGRMGVEIAIDAFARGAEVDVIYGHVDVKIPHFVNSYHVETTEEMAERMRELTASRSYDIIVGAAAPLDFTVEAPYKGKLKSDSSYTITLRPAPKTLKSITLKPKVLISFAADVATTEKELISSAMEKASKYGATLVAANPVNVGTYGFASEYDKVVVVDTGTGRIYDLGLDRKESLARKILDIALSQIKSRNG
ncbi:Coenzyme A biosynthesis bifunctional protein CoaBC [Acidilobus saccharovorans 345-15]|uniref:Coenzyme A biosynthesis bifunctional protein CoaBC n=1 Tax=Acidilobus saccharovorans (strain DSM 16705 / JCM 18335 / VKM B-2471 / 345-15) TaxID=666510 RepID=D9Q044_ACIS3|nr:bifunctional phosphopantothenoylcysteine decarboxylase/phosphopantothenate--cysteine ligase CoaBC [Acidilobus saccharovorans]ADL18682.1 Coenzyme A biosynthesis bifunctional protein CoaBC [Acidilobus saccharovorans 345-15]